MGRMNEELRSLCSRLCQKADLEATVSMLEAKRKTLVPEVKKLARAAKAEQRDVTRLERPTVAALVHHLAGDLEEQWETERREAEELYRVFGRALRDLPPKWRVLVLSSHTEFERTFGRVADKKRKLYNGMLKCDVFQYGK